ncbi:MAG: NDP-sugar synthase [Pseudomonadota bacterium]
MKAMILAAGKGTRMRPLTYLAPKPMVSIARVPVMETLIKHLAKAGVTEIVVNSSYLSHHLENYFRDGHQWGVNIGMSFEGYIENGSLTAIAIGSAGGIKKIQEFSGFFDEPFLVLCGDAYVDFDVAAFEKFHNDRGAIASLLMQDVPRDAVSEYGVVQADTDGRIQQFQEKPTPEEAVATTVNTGIYLFSPEAIDLIPVGETYDIGGDLFPDLVSKNLPFYAMCQDFNWLDIGGIRDFFTCQARVLQGEIPSFEIPGEQIHDQVWVGQNCQIETAEGALKNGVLIGSSSKIDPGVVIDGPAIIGANCHVGSGARLSNVFIDDHIRIAPGAELKDVIIAGGYVVHPDGESSYWSDSLDCVSDSRSQDGTSAQQSTARNTPMNLRYSA